MEKQHFEKQKFNTRYLNVILFFVCLLFIGATKHPVYLSVVNIEENKKENTLEISCKIFTTDLEAVLKNNNDVNINLLHPKDKVQMETLVNRYIQQHLKISVNQVWQKMQYLGYEQNEDAIDSFFQIDLQSSPSEMIIIDNILYDLQKAQINVVHVTINGNRKSNKLTNPDDKLVMRF